MSLLASPGIYRIRNIDTGKSYIGQTKDISARWRQHRSQLRCGTHGNAKLTRAWRKYGEASFVYEAVLYCETAELDRLEKALIAKYGSYNLSEGGRYFNCRDRATPEEVRAKIAAWHRGRKKSPLAVRRSAGSRRGMSPTQEHRDKIAAANRGRKPSPEETLRAVENKAASLGWVEISGPGGVVVVLNAQRAADLIGRSHATVSRCLKTGLATSHGYSFRRLPREAA